MEVKRWQIIGRGLTHRCPNCGARALFKKGSLWEVNSSCPACGLAIERDEGFFLGAMSLNFGLTTVLFIGPALYLYLRGTVGPAAELALLSFGALVVPALLYRPCRSWWLMSYYLFLPSHLPANRDASVHAGDESA